MLHTEFHHSTIPPFCCMLFPLNIWLVALIFAEFLQSKSSGGAMNVTFPSPFTHGCKFRLEPDLISLQHAVTALARIT